MQEQVKNKKYCKNCKWYKKDNDLFGIGICTHPMNWVTVSKECGQKCKRYQRKWYKFWVKD